MIHVGARKVKGGFYGAFASERSGFEYMNFGGGSC